MCFEYFSFIYDFCSLSAKRAVITPFLFEVTKRFSMRTVRKEGLFIVNLQTWTSMILTTVQILQVTTLGDWPDGADISVVFLGSTIISKVLVWVNIMTEYTERVCYYWNTSDSFLKRTPKSDVGPGHMVLKIERKRLWAVQTTEPFQDQHMSSTVLVSRIQHSINKLRIGHVLKMKTVVISINTTVLSQTASVFTVW